MSSVIQAENVGKKYLISHRDGRGERYLALRDVIANGARSLVKRNAKTASREEFWALRDVSFEIERGSRVGIIGRNGAGKSTLLKVLSRITDPSTGRITLRGRVASLLEVGTGFHPELTGRENIYLNGAILGMTRREIAAKFDEIVQFAEVERFLDTPVKRYSSGMYVRLAFAVAAHLEPEILVVDEVLAVGDAQFQKKCLGKMQDVGRDGRTVLFVSHDMRAIKSLCTSGIVMQSGRASELMPVDDAVAGYVQQMRTSELRLPVTVGDLTVHRYEVTQDAEATTEVDGGRPIDVAVEFELSCDLTLFRIGLFCRTAAGDVVFRSLAADWNLDAENLAAGRYVARTSIPRCFFAPGSYTLELTSSRYGLLSYLHDAGCEITIAVRPPVGFNEAHLGEKIVGHVLPPCEWSVSRVDMPRRLELTETPRG